MGLLDQLTNLSPEQNQGLLAAAAQMLQASGPSRMPTSFGQVLGQGIGSYQNAMTAQQELAQKRAIFEQAQALTGLKLKDAESDLKNQEMIREREAKIRSELMGAGVGATTMPQQAPPAPPASSAPMGGSMMAGMGQAMPSWMPQQAAPAAASAPVSAAPEDLQAATAQRLLKEAAIRSKYGDNEGANKLYEAAVKLQPKYSTDFRTAQGADGQLHNYVLADNGTWKDTGLGVKPEVTEVDLGGTKQFVDKNRVTPGQVFKKTMTFADQNSAARLAFDKSQANDNQDEAMDPLAVRMTAQQYLAGDTGALQNFGRGAQGAKNLNAVRLEIAKQANQMGLNGADIAAKVAEFQGVKAGQRTAGTRSASIEIAASEVQQLAPLALDASAKVARSGFKPFGNAQILFNSNVNDPAMRQFAMANTALVNAYGQAMARGGAATVSDKDHARELLSTAFDQPSYAAAVEQLQRETRAAQAAPKAVRKDLSAEVSGRHETQAAPAPKSVLKGQVMDGYKFKGGNPADPNAWEKI
jgi:hypothetical protein